MCPALRGFLAWCCRGAMVGRMVLTLEAVLSPAGLSRQAGDLSVYSSTGDKAFCSAGLC